MTKSTYITPSLGRKAIAIMGGWLLVSLWLASAPWSSASWLPDDWSISVVVGVVGAYYGIASGLSWLATIVPHSLARLALRAAIVSAAAYLLTRFANTDSWLRHASNLSGFLVFQSVWFFLLRVPQWTWIGSAGDVSAVASRQHQFRIADVILATTSIALLLAVGHRYVAPIDPVSYWSVMVLFWLVGPLISASLFVMMLARQASVRVGIIVLASTLAVGMCLALSAAEHATREGSPGWFSFLPLYSCFMLGFALTLLWFGLAARARGEGSRVSSDRAASELDS